MATLTRQQALAISQAAGAGDSAKVAYLLRDIPGDKYATGTWTYFAHRLADYIDRNYTGTPPFSVWNVKGNNKLPQTLIPKSAKVVLRNLPFLPLAIMRLLDAL